jgi:hypothetical protein
VRAARGEDVARLRSTLSEKLAKDERVLVAPEPEVRLEPPNLLALRFHVPGYLDPDDVRRVERDLREDLLEVSA